MPSVRMVVPRQRTRSRLVYRNEFTDTRVYGVTPNWQVARSWDLADGAFFTGSDMDSKRKVIVLGSTPAKKLFGETCHVVRYPLDFSWSVKRFLNAVRPDAVALVELEIWPNFVGACGRREIPVCVINGRLSERSFRGYKRIRRWIGPSFRRLAFAAVQDEE